MSKPKLPPLPDLLEKAISHFAQAVHYSDTNGRIGAANNLRKEIKAYAIAAIQTQNNSNGVVVSQGVPDVDDLRDRLVAISSAVADSDDREAQAIIRTTLEVLASAPPAPQASVVQQEKTMPITDDNGKAIRYQYRVIEQRGNWFLLYDQHQLGNTVVHEFRIQKLKHDILLFPGITLAEAQKIFAEKVEADNE